MSHHKTREAEAVRKRAIWESYAGMHHLIAEFQSYSHPVLVLPPKIRLNVSLALCAVAIAGIFISDRLEQAIPPSQKSTPNPPKQL